MRIECVMNDTWKWVLLVPAIPIPIPTSPIPIQIPCRATPFRSYRTIQDLSCCWFPSGIFTPPLASPPCWKWWRPLSKSCIYSYSLRRHFRNDTDLKTPFRSQSATSRPSQIDLNVTCWCTTFRALHTICNLGVGVPLIVNSVSNVQLEVVRISKFVWWAGLVIHSTMGNTQNTRRERLSPKWYYLWDA